MKTVASHYITIGETRLPLIVRRHPHARSFVLRYDARAHQLRLTVPRYASVHAALAFAQTKEVWVKNQLAATPRISLQEGAEIPLWGRQVHIQYIGGRSMVTLEGNVLKVTGARESMKRRIKDYILREMKIRAQSIIAHYTSQLGITISALRITDMRSRWGSCSIDGVIALSLRLAFTPPEVMEYVIVHELAHLKHHNHSKRFWQLVAALYPSYSVQEVWLKQHGHSVWNINMESVT